MHLKNSRGNLAAIFALPFNVNVPIDDYHYQDIALELNSAEPRKFNASTVLEAGSFYDGTHRSAQLQFVWQPSVYFSATVGYKHDTVNLPAGHFTTRLYSLNTTVAFNADWAWFNLIPYDNALSSLGVNSRLRWIPEPGDEAYLVLNYGAFNDPVLAGRGSF